ncbi:MAG: imidazole glycerol phosphate synthase subunit HisH [Thermodesulfobacteriota bacterium]|nr:imidazole glycerol phosphate synthase subunit HisH [Thermodesulfobacteriota bacterium]
MISIINYKAGNLKSVERALRHLNMPCRITAEYKEIISSERVVFPGVGSAGKAMEVLRSQGLDQLIHDIIDRNIPFLGICLGAQIILGKSDEDNTSCLDIIPGSAKRFPDMGIKIPHMGWNHISPAQDHPVLKGIDSDAQFYFVHSFYPQPKNSTDIIATTDYGIKFASVIGRKNVIAMQFHPEKSGRQGLQLLKNFCEWDGKT